MSRSGGGRLKWVNRRIFGVESDCIKVVPNSQE